LLDELATGYYMLGGLQDKKSTHVIVNGPLSMPAACTARLTITLLWFQIALGNLDLGKVGDPKLVNKYACWWLETTLFPQDRSSLPS
jgi:hypothetical protein